MHSPGINGEGELRGQLANPSSPGKGGTLKPTCVSRRKGLKLLHKILHSNYHVAPVRWKCRAQSGQMDDRLC